MFLQLILVLVVLIPLLAIVLDSQVGRALASRLERADAPVIVLASSDIKRVPMPVLAGLREVARSGKLHVFVEGDGAGPAESE